MVDFKDIQTLYPDAYGLMVKYLCPNSNLGKHIRVECGTEKLYEFFDATGIYCTLNVETYYQDRNPKYLFKIKDIEIKYAGAAPIESIKYSDRKTATEKMFTHAFSHLQYKIKSQNFNPKFNNEIR